MKETYGRHQCDKPKSHPTYSRKWSGVTYAPETNKPCPDCGEMTHLESGEHYCPRCDDYKRVR